MNSGLGTGIIVAGIVAAFITLLILWILYLFIKGLYLGLIVNKDITQAQIRLYSAAIVLLVLLLVYGVIVFANFYL